MAPANGLRSCRGAPEPVYGTQPAMHSGDARIVTVQYSDLADPTCDLTSSVAEVVPAPGDACVALEWLIQNPPITAHGDNACCSQAYGPEGLGILLIAGVPHLSELRHALLPLAERFAVCHASD